MGMDLICPECGIIDKSGKRSCCGRGGSWFGNCGSFRNASRTYTWYDGIRVCKARQFQAELGLQRRSSQPRSDASSDDESMGVDFNVVIAAARVFASSPGNTSTPMPVPRPVPLPAKTSIHSPARMSVADNAIAAVTGITHTSLVTSNTAQECETPLRILTHVILALIVVY